MEFRETTLGDDRDRRAPREVPTVAPEILILALLQSPSFPSAFDIVQICPAIIPGVTNEAKQVGVTQNLREHSDNQWAVIGSDNMVLHKKKASECGKNSHLGPPFGLCMRHISHRIHYRNNHFVEFTGRIGWESITMAT